MTSELQGSSSAGCTLPLSMQGAVLQVDTPVGQTIVGLGGLFVTALNFARGIHPQWWSFWPCLAVSALLTEQMYWPRFTVRRCDQGLRIQSLWRRLRLTPANTLQVREAGERLSVLLTDGRLVTLSRLSDLARGTLAECLRPSEPEAFVFRLSGLPALGRSTRWLSRLPLVTAWLRPRVHIDNGCFVLAWGFWSRRVPLCSIVRLSVTNRGVKVGLSDSTQLEFVTFAGVPPRWYPYIYDFNAQLASHLHASRARALARALNGYRKASG